jgi:hypothetical protein
MSKGSGQWGSSLVMERTPVALATQRHTRAAEPVEQHATATSKSATAWRFAAQAAKALRVPLSGLTDAAERVRAANRRPSTTGSAHLSARRQVRDNLPVRARIGPRR